MDAVAREHADATGARRVRLERRAAGRDEDGVPDLHERRELTVEEDVSHGTSAPGAGLSRTDQVLPEVGAETRREDLVENPTPTAGASVIRTRRCRPRSPRSRGTGR